MRSIRRTFRNAPPAAWFGMVVVALYIFVAIFAPVLTPFKETQIVAGPYEPWSAKYLLGTDNLGRDMLTRLIYGARNTIGLTLFITILSFIFGVGMGMLSAALGGWMDQLLGRIVDIAMSIPALIFALLFLSFFGNSVPVLITVVTVIEATRIFRVTRAAAETVVVNDYIEDARLRGESLLWIVSREILPNILPPLIAEFGLRFCFVVLLISSLSFLGLGIQPPTADWGSMVRDNAQLIGFGDSTPLLPAAAIGLLVVAVNLIVDWVLDRASRLQS
ncbi:MAG: ABC transporter permease [Thermomicrobiales bacterium]